MMSKFNVMGYIKCASVAFLLCGPFSYFSVAYEAKGIITRGYPAGINQFYGYSSTSTGPGDDAFSRSLAKAEEKSLPLVVVTSDSCVSCDSFAKDIDDRASDVTMVLKSGCINTYFRGTAKASKDAVSFISKLKNITNSGAESHVKGLIRLSHSNAAHAYAMYFEFEDGCKFVRSANLPGDWESFKEVYYLWYNDYLSLKVVHKVTAAARFANANSTYAQLQATESTKQVPVLLVRRNLVEKQEEDSLIVDYPDGTRTEKSLIWEEGDSAKTVDIDVCVDGKAWWGAGHVIKMTIADLNGNKVDESAIHCVDGGNAFAFPDLEFDEEGAWGQWTLYSDENWNAALQKVYAANTYSQPDTNDNAQVQRIVMDIPISPSNRYEVVYTNDITFFADSKATVDIEHGFEFTVTNLVTTVYTNAVAAFDKSQKADEDAEALTVVFPGELQVVTNYVAAENVKDPENDKDSKIGKNVTVTNFVYGVENLDDANPVEWEWARTTEEKQVECFTNKIYYVETNAEHAVGTAVTNAEDLVVSANGRKSYYLNKKATSSEVEIPVSESFASNCVYAVTPQLDSSAVTNLYSSESATFSGVVTVTNVTTILPCDANHAKPSTSEPVAKADDPHPVVNNFKCADLQTYYTVQSIWDETVEQPYECFGTNRTFYVQLPGNVTNEDVVARVPVPKAGDWATTNFYFYALTNGEHTVSSTEVTWTNFEATATVDCTNFYYTIVTNEYQYGEAGREAGGRDERGIQSFVLKVTGGAVWNPATVAFATAVFDSDEFAEFCENNKVVTLLQECSDPDTGVSLFSHTVAANGRSGSAFLSRNGLDASKCVQPPASNVFEVALYRPDGTLAGILAPQMNDGACNRDENLTRLRELLLLADDLTESGNNAAATTTLKAVYGTTTNDVEKVAEQYQTLSISDKKDVFELVEVPAGVVVSVTANSLPKTRNDGQEKPTLRVWKYTSGAKTATSDIAPFSVDADGEPVWKFSEDDVKDGLYADVTAWTNDYAATENHGVSTFLYPLLVNAAPEYPGVISFTFPATNTVVDADDNVAVELKIERTGYTGGATAKVELTRCELPATSYSWANSGNATNLVWRDGEPDVKSVFVNVKNVTWEDSVSNLVFTITSVTGASLDEEKKECKIAIQQEDDETALTGRILISNPEPSADGVPAWKKSGTKVKVVISRERVLNEATGKNEARGEAHATISATGGAVLSTNRLDWLSGERTGEREITVTMPDVGAAGQQHVVLNVTGTDCDGKKISETTTSQLKFTVVPSDAPEFMSGIDAEAYKYVAFDKSAMLSGYDPDTMEIVEPALLSGSLPPGLTVKADGENWELRIKGVPTGTGLYTADYQLVLRRKLDGNLVKTMPVAVKIDVKALGGGASEEADAVIPAFAEKRTWQYLPMTNSAGRLMGLLNLSASPRGSVSARYTTAGKTVSFNATALDSVVADETAGGYRARSSMNKAGYSLKAEFTTDGRVFAKSQPQDGGELEFASEPDSRPWLSIDGGAAAWKGRYAVAIPAKEAGGAPAVITLNASSSAMVKYGKVTYNGVLPNGRPFSGVTAFVPAAEGAAEVKLPVFWSSAAGCFSAMLALSGTAGDVKVSAAEGMEPFWFPADGEETALSTEPEGGMFVAKDWVDVWKINFGGAEMLRVKYDGKEGNATVAGSGKSLVVADPGSAEEDGFQLESIVLNRASGMITGTLKVKIPGQNATVNFRGVALPHGKDHFMSGLAWYTEEQEGAAVRKSVPVELVPAN